MNDLEKLFMEGLKGTYDAEQQLVKALPELAESAQSPELRTAFNEHLGQTKNHVSRLEQVFRALGQEPERRSCHGMEGIIDDGQMISREFKGNTGLDAALIVAGQKSEHFEITSYGSLCTWAKELGHDEILPLLKENMAEEKEADAKLTRLAKEACNIEALHHDTEKKSTTAAAASKMATAGP